MLDESTKILEEKLAAAASERADILPLAKNLKSALGKALAATSSTSAASTNVAASLEEAAQAMLDLEGKLSVGSRAAYGELAGQLRVFADSASSGQVPNHSAFGLFASRTYKFLASELQVPPPV